MQVLDATDLAEGAFEEILSFLRAGGVIGIPTDTAYGLAADPFSESAVRKIFQIKGRAETNPVLLLVDSVEMAETVANLSDHARELARRYWPGPLTMILPAKKHVPETVTAGTGNIGVRWSGAPFVERLVSGLGRPITGTSANRSGNPAAVTVEEVRTQLEGLLELCVDGGRLPTRGGSTLLDLAGPTPRILRAGPLTPDQLNDLLS